MTDEYEICRRAPPLKRTALEEQAWALAKRAQDYAHSQVPRFPSWDDLEPHGQAAMMNSALAHICLQTVFANPTLGAN